MRTNISTEFDDLAAALSTAYAAVYRHGHSPYTLALGHQAVRALQLAAEPGTTIQLICRQLGCATNTGSEIVSRLAGKGLVQKTRRATDERVVEVTTTADGDRILIEQTGLDRARLARGLSGRTEQERDVIQSGLNLLLACVTDEPKC